MKKLFALAAVVGALAATIASATSAGVRYVTVINLLSAPATATLVQHGSVGTKTIASRYDHTFDIPPGATTLVVSSSVCPTDKRLSLPTKETLRVVINTGCALSVQ